MQRRIFLSIVIPAMVAACGSGPTDASDDAIQGGRRDPRHAAVGLVWMRGGGLCSGALVAPDVVLTAGHCVTQPIEGFYLGRGAALASVTGRHERPSAPEWFSSATARGWGSSRRPSGAAHSGLLATERATRAPSAAMLVACPASRSSVRLPCFTFAPPTHEATPARFSVTTT